MNKVLLPVLVSSGQTRAHFRSKAKLHDEKLDKDLGFQVTGMIEDCFGFEIFDSGIFSGRKIWQVFFWAA